MPVLQTPGQVPASGAPDSVGAGPAVADKGGMLPMSDATLSQPSAVSRPENDPLRMAGGNSQPVCSCISLTNYAPLRGHTVFSLSAAFLQLQHQPPPKPRLLCHLKELH